MPKVQDFSPPPATVSLGLSADDWLFIDEALNTVAKSLRKIEKELRQKPPEEAENQPPQTQGVVSFSRQLVV